MSSNRYMENLCFRLHMQGLSLDKIAKEARVTEKGAAKYIADYKERNGQLGKVGIDELLKTVDVNLDVFEHKLETVEDYFTLPQGRDETLFLHKNADKQREKISEYIEEKYKGKRIKVLYMSDLHIPFTIYEMVKYIIDEHKDADILVLNGDLLDLFNVSTFAKDKSVALKRELQEGREFLEIVSQLFDDVIVVEGNHERRLRNFIKHTIPQDIQFLFPQDALQVIQEGTVFDLDPLENVHVVGSWWIKIYDTIFAHPDNFNSPPMRTVINTSEHFMLVKNIPHRALAIGHTHQAGKYIDRGRMVMETGCLNYDMDYKNGSKFGKMDWTRAYALFYFDDGEVDFNESNVITLPV